ncbi:hypothetical protein HF086_007764 [Spodoptera exigua]|uniref:Uncharacterized protein n=1 Tax=Spodoptera exigua TaxID=7107 RepID=A0A922SI71_SPOEX|nr:hypothetical protein HF086_007764 [Spodoptera exigua]
MNIYYTHCSVLIIIAESKLKMSRSYCSYDEDWQRRKSILIRSLFHDLPILSPVTEESDDSFPPVRAYETLGEPPRPYSPLPPLIIERVPKTNRHDEPEEHYKKLLIKIKKIYRRLFILNRNLSSDEEFLCDTSITDHDDDFDNPIAINNNDDDNLESPIADDNNQPVNETKETIDLDDNKDDDQSDVDNNTNSNDETVGQSSHSNVSNGYRADSESVETVIVDVLNYTKSTSNEASKDESVSINSMEEIETNPDNIEGDRRSDKVCSSSNKETKSEESISVEEPRLLLTAGQETNTNTTVCAARMFEQIVADIEEIADSDDKSIIITNQDNKNTANNTTIDQNEEIFHQEEIIEILSEEEITDREMIEIEEKGNRSVEKPGSSDKTSNNKEGTYQRKPPQEITDTIRQEQQNKFEDLNEFRMNMNLAYDDESDNTSSSDEEWSSLKDSEEENSQELSTNIPDKESQVYEDSPKSIILPVSRMKRTATQAMLDRREELFGTEINTEARAVNTTDTYGESFEDIEEMRSQNRKLSQATVLEKTYESISEETNFNRSSHDLTDMTSSPQNGAGFNISKRKTSDDLGEVLARILNESQNNVENTNLFRKRKNYENVSVQTNENVTWDDIRKDLFVGAPKILRLCSCVDHVCQ